MKNYIFIYLLTFGNFCSAAIVDNLYKEEIIVENQSLDIRKKAFSEGLENVIVKVSGLQSSFGALNLRKKDNVTGNFVQSYFYKNKEGSLYLNVDYNEKKINDALRLAKQPVWGKERPLVLLWLALDVQNSNSSDMMENITSKINQLADTRALPVMLPLLDVIDNRAVSPEDIWHLSPDKLSSGSKRYGSDAILAGRITNANRWHGKWRLIINDTAITWNSVGNKVDVMLSNMVDDLSLKLMQHYAVWSDEQTKDEIVLKLSGVKNFNSYVKALEYLNKINIITNVTAKNIENDEVVFVLNIKGELNSLVHALNIGKIFIKEKDAIGNQLFYKT